MKPIRTACGNEWHLEGSTQLPEREHPRRRGVTIGDYLFAVLVLILMIAVCEFYKTPAKTPAEQPEAEETKQPEPAKVKKNNGFSYRFKQGGWKVGP